MDSSAKRRVYISLPQVDRWDPWRVDVRDEFLLRVRSAGYETEIIMESGMAANMPWSAENVNKIMRRCVGAAILAMPRWTFSTDQGEKRFTSEYAHYEGAVANSLNLPLLIIAESGIEQRGILWKGAGHLILSMPADADKKWFDSDSFSQRFGLWKRDLDERMDVFLGYCSKAKATADAIQLYLTKTLGLRVMDWAMDFVAGGTIIEQIERAAKLCSCGVFLFTRDDPLESSPERAAPRDNVVFEAGLFASARGRDRILIIREDGAKMPADLGGNIYASLKEDREIAPIQQLIREFVERRL